MAIDGKLRQSIEAELRKLRLRTDLPEAELESRIACAADDLTRRAKIALLLLPDLPDPGEVKQRRNGPVPAFNKLAPGKALLKLAINLDAAFHLLAFMPEPAVAALAEAGLVPQKAQQALEGMLKMVEGAFLSFAPKKPGRPPFAHPQQRLIDNFAAAYFNLSGKRPTISTRNGQAGGGFFEFIKKMLQVMPGRLKEIKPEYLARQTCRVWRKSHLSRPIKSF